MFAWVGAGEAVSLSNLPHQLAVALGTTDFVGGLIATTILFLLFVIPILYFTRGKNMMLSLIVGVLTICIATALTWIPYFIIVIVMVLLPAAFISNTFRTWVTGSGER